MFSIKHQGFNKMKLLNKAILGSLCLIGATACQSVPRVHGGELTTAAKSELHIETSESLLSLAPPKQKLTVAVYNFQDQTGQFKSSEGGQTLSKAVSQGGTSILLKALQDAGNRSDRTDDRQFGPADYAEPRNR